MKKTSSQVWTLRPCFENGARARGTLSRLPPAEAVVVEAQSCPELPTAARVLWGKKPTLLQAFRISPCLGCAGDPQGSSDLGGWWSTALSRGLGASWTALLPGLRRTSFRLANFWETEKCYPDATQFKGLLRST